MQHLTVRKVPEKLADALQREKERRGTLGGTWSDTDLAEFEAATKTFEQVDEELWD